MPERFVKVTRAGNVLFETHIDAEAKAVLRRVKNDDGSVAVFVLDVVVPEPEPDPAEVAAALEAETFAVGEAGVELTAEGGASV